MCSLGSCSWFWRELYGLDCVWESLYRDRWPALDLGRDSSSAPQIKTHQLDPQIQSSSMLGLNFEVFMRTIPLSISIEGNHYMMSISYLRLLKETYGGLLICILLHQNSDLGFHWTRCLSSVLYLESSSREKFKDKIAWRFPGKKCMGGLNTSIVPADLIERILGEQVQIACENSTNVMLYRIGLSII